MRTSGGGGENDTRHDTPWSLAGKPDHGRHSRRGPCQAQLVNGTEPPFKGLPEPEIADMERVLDEIEIFLPVLGFDVLRPAGYEAGANASQAAIADLPANQKSEFVSRDGASEAMAREAGDEFVVLAGSVARLRENPSAGDFILRKRKELREAGSLVPTEDGKGLRFTTDVAFDSPSSRAPLFSAAM